MCNICDQALGLDEKYTYIPITDFNANTPIYIGKDRKNRLFCFAKGEINSALFVYFNFCPNCGKKLNA